MTDTNGVMWNKLTERELNHLIKLLLGRQRINGIKYVRQVNGVGLTEAIAFVDSGFMREKVINADPTRLSLKDELKAEMLRVVTDMLTYINDSEMSAIEKYQFITDNHVPMMFALCTED